MRTRLIWWLLVLLGTAACLIVVRSQATVVPALTNSELSARPDAAAPSELTQGSESAEQRTLLSTGPVELLLQAGIKAYEQADIAGLESALERLQTADSRHPGNLLLQAMKLVRENQPQLALERLHQAAESAVTKPRALALAGELLYRLGDFQNAVGVLQAAVVANPDAPTPRQWLAAWFYDIGAMDDALLHLDRLVELLPNDPKACRMRGVILADFERFPEAISAYDQALARDPKGELGDSIRLELARCLVADRQAERAATVLSQASQSGEQQALLGEALLALGQQEQAQRHLKRSLELEPQHFPALVLSGKLQRAQGNLDKSRQLLESALELDHHDLQLRYQLMNTYAALGETKLAEHQQQEMERLRQLRFQFTELHHQSRANPQSADLRYQLALTANELGMRDMAVSWLQATLALNPHDDRAIALYKRLNESSSANATDTPSNSNSTSGSRP